MACPKCGCKEVYQFDGWGDDLAQGDDRTQRCAACGEVFDIEDSADEDEECPECNGQGTDKWNDHVLPCPVCRATAGVEPGFTMHPADKAEASRIYDEATAFCPLGCPSGEACRAIRRGDGSPCARGSTVPDGVMGAVTTPDDLPGMWDRSDFEGGQDEVRGSTVPDGVQGVWHCERGCPHPDVCEVVKFNKGGECRGARGVAATAKTADGGM